MSLGNPLVLFPLGTIRPVDTLNRDTRDVLNGFFPPSAPKITPSDIPGG
jgi:hypothetical protein